MKLSVVESRVTVHRDAKCVEGEGNGDGHPPHQPLGQGRHCSSPSMVQGRAMYENENVFL